MAAVLLAALSGSAFGALAVSHLGRCVVRGLARGALHADLRILAGLGLASRGHEPCGSPAWL